MRPPLSAYTVTVLEDLHEHLCTTVPLIGGNYSLCGQQINALRAALPHVIEPHKADEEARLDAIGDTDCSWFSGDLDWPAIHVYGGREHRPWWRRLWFWITRGDLTHE